MKKISLFLLFLVNSFNPVCFGKVPDGCSRYLKPFEITVMASDDSDSPAVNTINGSGLCGDLCDNKWSGTWGTAPNGGGATNPHPGTTPGVAWIKFEFDKIYNLKEMLIWNYNEQTKRGLKKVIIEYTKDGTKWKVLGNITIAEAPDVIGYQYNTTIDFKGKSAKAVIITALNGENVGNYGTKDNRYGLSEVRFCVYGSNKSICKNEYRAPEAELALECKRGVTLDRIARDPVPEELFFTSDDVKLIKSMGFDFVKILIDPETYKSGSELKNTHFLDKIINTIIKEKMTIVLCVHPEPDFKENVFGDKKEFAGLCMWYENIARYLSGKWTEKQLIFQQMTEPSGNSSNPKDWNSWNKLLPEMWKSIRKGMPKHTIILSGDNYGRLESLVLLKPVKDKNVMYAFSCYEPLLFTHQGAYWLLWKDSHFPYVNVPYPSSSDIIAEKLSDVDFDDIVPEASLIDDLGADSLALVELVMSMEEVFDIDIDDDDAEKLITVKDAIDYIKAKS